MKVSIEELMHRLGDPQEELRFVHVAGTNGKGSTCAFIASVLQAAGYRVGLFTSPHLRYFGERFRVNGQNMPEEEFERRHQEVQEICDSLPEHIPLFGRLTAVGFRYFRDMNCDIVVLEVGLGGRLDATNIISRSEVSVITALGLEHTEQLGDTIESIAYEKGCITKEGCDVVLYGQSPEAEGVIRRICEERHAPLHIVDVEQPLPEDIRIRLLGGYQKKNANLALAALRVLQEKGWNISREALVRGMEETEWPGRFEILHRSPDFIVDGGHNPHGVEALVSCIKEYYPGKKVIFLTTVMKDKEYDRMYEMTIPLAGEFITMAQDYERAMETDALADYLRGRCSVPVTAAGSAREAIDLALKHAGPEDVIVAFGSLYLVADIRAYFGKGIG